MGVRIEQSFLEKLKERYNLVEVVSEHIPDLKQGGGGEWVGKCPLHDDKTASCTVNRLRFHCFGCHAHLDIFGWVQRMSGLTFPQAVKSLSNGAVPLVRGEDIKPRSIPTHTPYDASAVERILDANYHASAYFAQPIRDPVALAYFNQRFGSETGNIWNIGYAPNVRDGLVDHLQLNRVDLTVARDAGLVAQSYDGSWCDRLRDRIVIPMYTPISGHCVGYIGRIVPRAENINLPKYINPPTNWAFEKKRYVFNVAAVKSDYIVVTEGPIDCISLNRAGVPAVASCMGCKLSQQQFDILRHYYKQIFVMFDGDKPGLEGCAAAMELGQEAQFDMRAVLLSDKLDPDTWSHLGLPLKSLPIIRAQDFFTDSIVLGVTVNNKVKYDKGVLNELSRPYVLDNMRNGWAQYNVVDWVMSAYPEFAAEIREATLEMVRDTDVRPDGTHCFKVERVKTFLRAWMKPSREVRKLHGKKN